MYPVLFTFGPITLHTYGSMLALGALAGLLVLTRLSAKSDMNPEKVQNLTLAMLIAGLAGGRAAFWILEPSIPWSQPWRLFAVWEGGLVFYGGLATALPVGWWLARRYRLALLPLLDNLAPALALGQAIGRLGCFASGDSYGLPFSGPWAVVFTHPMSLAPKGVPLHPTQLYTAGALAMIFAILLFVWKHRRVHGQVLFAYLALHGAARLIIEQFRGDWRGEFLLSWLTPTGLAALVISIVGIIFTVAILVRNRDGNVTGSF